MADFSALPSSYCNYTRAALNSVLGPWKLEDLITESLKCNARAQKAVLVKIELGLHEAKDWSIETRVNAILSFWDRIKDINAESKVFGLVWEYSIMSSIKETVMSDCIYSMEPELPDYSIIESTTSNMELHGLEERWRNEIKECYLSYKNAH